MTREQPTLKDIIARRNREHGMWNDAEVDVLLSTVAELRAQRDRLAREIEEHYVPLWTADRIELQRLRAVPRSSVEKRP